MKNNLPALLNEIVNFLRDESIDLSKRARGGRLNSAFNEDGFSILISRFKCIIQPNIRDWMDFSFEENGIFYPVNIKVSTTNTTDNLNCKLGIYYAITAKIPHFNNIIDWDQYFRVLSENLSKSSKDIFFTCK